MRSLLILLASASVCFGQYMPMADPAFVARANYEALSIADTNNYNLITNITGYPVYAWYTATGNVGTNSGTLTVTNLTPWADANNIDLTNKIAGSFPLLTTNALNGYSCLSFDGIDDYVRQLAPTASAAGIQSEFFFVLCYTNISANSYFIATRNGSIQYSARAANAAIRTDMASSVIDGVVTNKWMVLHVTYSTNNANEGMIFTNGICAKANSNTGTPGAQDRIILGCDTTLANFANINLAEVIMFRTNLGPAVSQGTPYPVGIRSNIFYVLTNKYAISLNSGP